MVLIGMSILPHGSMILDPTVLDLPSGCDELHTAAKYVGDYLRDHEPDIVVLATPHGINISDSIGKLKRFRRMLISSELILSLLNISIFQDRPW